MSAAADVSLIISISFVTMATLRCLRRQSLPWKLAAILTVLLTQCQLDLVDGFTSPTTHRLSALSCRKHQLPLVQPRLLVPPSSSTWSRLESAVSNTAIISNRQDETAAVAATGTAGSIPYVETVIVGGGPAGLLAAIMLAQQQQERDNRGAPSSPYIHVYDRQPHGAPPPDDSEAWNSDAAIARYYLIGLGGRGQAALQAMNVWDDVVLPHCVAVVGRKDWPPGSLEGNERVFTLKDKKTTAQILPREKLVGILQRYIATTYATDIQIHYGCQVEPVEFDYDHGQRVLLQVNKCVAAAAPANADRSMNLQQPQGSPSSSDNQDIVCNVDDNDPLTLLQTSFVIAADGTQRTFANAMERADCAHRAMLHPLQRLVAPRPVRVKRYADDNQRVYKTIPLKLPASWRFDLNYSARTKGSGINLDALPANANGDYCAVLLLMHDDPFAKANTDPELLREWMNQNLPQFSQLMSDETMEAVAKKPVSYLPAFRYVGPRLHQGNRCLILGDCAHTVKPYFGLGANSALEDVLILRDVLKQCHGDITKAVPEFSKQRAPQAKTMVRLSRELDRPGKLGFVTFILPIILDSIFSGIAPKVFMPNIIAMMQREEFTFTQVARRKRFDRLLQVAVLVGGFSATGWLVRTAIHALAAALNKSVTTTAAISVAVMAGIFVLQKQVPALAPPTILSRIASKITNSRTHLTPLRRLMGKKGDAKNGESFLTPLGFKNENNKSSSSTTS